MNGRDFVRSLPAKPGKERWEKILKAICDGHFAPLNFVPVHTEFRGHKGTLWVTADALMVGEVDPIRFSICQLYQQMIADALGCVLPTAKISDLIYSQAVNKLSPCLQDADPADRKAHGWSPAMDDAEAMIQHSDCVTKALAGRKGLSAPVGKDWIASNKLTGHPSIAANYGLHDPSAPNQSVTGVCHVWQSVGTKHNPEHDDYSQVVRLILVTMDVDGVEMRVEDVARSTELWGLVSSEGVMRSLRHPAVPDPNGPISTEITEPDYEIQPKKPIFTRIIHYGDIGQDVSAWQTIIGVKADGIFGKDTKSATMMWQKSHKLTADGIVGPKTMAAAMGEIIPGAISTAPGTVLSTAVLTAPKTILAKNYGHVERKFCDWITVHSMENSEKPSTAEDTCYWDAGKYGEAPMASWNWAFDCDSAVICVPEEYIAFHVGKANPYSIGYEHAGTYRQTRAEWLDDYSAAMLYLSAKTAATVTIPRWNVPIQYINAVGIKRAKLEFIDKGLPVPNELRGFTSHSEIVKSGVFGGSHVDPGEHFPWDQYLKWVAEG